MLRQSEIDKTFYVYMYTSPSGKHYVGRTCQEKSRRSGGKGYGYKTSTAFWNAIQKYGWDNFEYKVLEENIKCNDIDERENYWIDYYHSSIEENGYNLLKPKDTHKIASEETRKKQSIAHKGEKAYWYGKHRPFPQKALEKAVEVNNKPVMQFDLEGNYIQTFKSRKEAAKSVNRNETQISECCYSNGRSCGGYQWCNVGDENKIKKYKDTHETVGSIVQMLDGVIINIFKNAREAAESMNKNPKSLYKPIKKKKIAYGFQWIRLSDVNPSILNEYYTKKNK